MKWKSCFLSSGIPLEHEIAAMLYDLGFHVRGEFPYTRYGQPENSDCSIDIVADAYLPVKDKNTFRAELIMPIECKYRVPTKSWLFMGDHNDGDFSPSLPAGMREFPAFTAYKYDEMPVIDFSCTASPALKATEINTQTGETQDKDIKHALNQLRYALPSLMHRQISINGSCHPRDSRPFFIFPILVTNAPLRLMNENMTVESVSSASSLDEISKAVDCVDLYSNHPDSFEDHCKVVFKDFLPFVAGRTSFHAYDAIQEFTDKDEPEYRTIRGALRSLHFGGHLRLQSNMFRQFWVCNVHSLRKTIKKAMLAIDKSTLNSVLLSPELDTYKRSKET